MDLNGVLVALYHNKCSRVCLVDIDGYQILRNPDLMLVSCLIGLERLGDVASETDL
jgi:hypothetical protein